MEFIFLWKEATPEKKKSEVSDMADGGKYYRKVDQERMEKNRAEKNPGMRLPF